MIHRNATGDGYSDLCTVSLVQGEAQGGGFEAALSSHVIIAEQGSFFGFPEGLFGMYPGMGAKRLLELRCGKSKALEIIGSARRWSAEELHRLGVVDFVVNRERGSKETKEILRSIGNLDDYKNRYASLRLEDLENDVLHWVEQAFSISDRNLRTMKIILDAQARAASKRNFLLEKCA